MFDESVDTIETQRDLCGMWHGHNKDVHDHERVVHSRTPVRQVLLSQDSRALSGRACANGLECNLGGFLIGVYAIPGQGIVFYVCAV